MSARRRKTRRSSRRCRTTCDCLHGRARTRSLDAGPIDRRRADWSWPAFWNSAFIGPNVPCISHRCRWKCSLRLAVDAAVLGLLILVKARALAEWISNKLGPLSVQSRPCQAIFHSFSTRTCRLCGIRSTKNFSKKAGCSRASPKPICRCSRFSNGWRRDQLEARLTLSLSPTLCAMLLDQLLCERYARHLDGLIELAEKEIHRTHWDRAFRELAWMYHHKFSLGARDVAALRRQPRRRLQTISGRRAARNHHHRRHARPAAAAWRTIRRPSARKF